MKTMWMDEVEAEYLRELLEFLKDRTNFEALKHSRSLKRGEPLRELLNFVLFLRRPLIALLDEHVSKVEQEESTDVAA